MHGFSSVMDRISMTSFDIYTVHQPGNLRNWLCLWWNLFLVGDAPVTKTIKFELLSLNDLNSDYALTVQLFSL